MDDVNEAKNRANNDHKGGLDSPITTTWSSDARNTYNSQREWLNKQDESKKSGS